MERTTTMEPITFVTPMAQDTLADSRKVGTGVGFERIRRITGYLVGTLDRFNDAKRAEESERVKHNISRKINL